ncbi:zinc finger FYVE domain-containing protein 9 isoform X2 [Venturia canescens]|uniref:zinc finger FYVE domain-containing protein 9 isoform X2 n=1 Tax=Venturia canescens TaxID=32260 RepID=UPI001C9CABA7|nr:zinc finger FYVE domain-containing protein 9 isoform X2 [Venturia canescens]
MEKFAVDLDRVLDEFEFNEDCAEQVALSLDADNLWTQSQTKPITESSSNFIQSTSTYEDGGSQSRTLEAQRSGDKISNIDTTRLEETLDIRKMGGKRENSDSVNDFYSHGKGSDDKLQEKRYASFRDSEPVSLTIRNDISQKLVQKQQNESGSGASKNHNSYDKKLNQPNIRPSVSNVFSSLNEYINAPSGNLEQRDNSIVSTEASSLKVESRVKTNMKKDDATSQESKGAGGSSRDGISDKTIGSKTRDLQSSNKLSRIPPKYQNILVPVKLDASTGSHSKPEDGQTSAMQFEDILSLERISCDSQHPEHVLNIDTDIGIACGTKRKQTSLAAEVRLPPARTDIKDEAEAHGVPREDVHVYENMKVPMDKREMSEVHAIAISNPESAFKPAERQDSKRHYENMIVEEKTKDKDEAAGYERICEARESLSSLETKRPSVHRGTAPGFQGIIKSTVVTKEAQPIGFGTTIDDLSEEELNKYLAELEAEERANEGKAMYENVEPPAYEPPRDDDLLRRVITTSRKLPTEDEDANEAPIFETVTIGVLPALSEEKLQEKAKKFPVIDYSKQQASSSDSDPRYNDFLDKKAQEESSGKIDSEGRVIDEKVGEETSNKSVDSRENIDSEMLECRTCVVTQEFTESEWSDDFSMNCAPASTAKDSSSGVTESEISNVDNANRQFENNEIVEETIENISNMKTTIVDTKYSENSVSTENNVNSCIDEDSVNSNDDKILSELPSSSNNTLNDAEESTKDDGSDHEDKLSRPQTLDIVSTVTMPDNSTTGEHESLEPESETSQQQADNSQDFSESSSFESTTILGKQPPFWIPDNAALNCMLCEVKFTVIKRRHHCRACGKVLCNKCCSMKYRLQYQGNIDSRVCSPCYQLLIKAEQDHESGDCSTNCGNSSPSNINSSQGRQPNPNNPMEYCSTIPPLQQLAGGLPPPPTVMVPVGVLKREGSSKQRSEGQKSVMFSDELDTSWDLKPPYRKIGKRTSNTPQMQTSGTGKRQNIPPMDPNTNSYIPQDPDLLPPTVTIHKGEISYHECDGSAALYKSLKNECEPPIMFAINRNLYAYVKITNLNCCVNRVCWNVTSRGLACVGQDEIIFLVETLPDEMQIPKDLLIHINQIYVEAIKGNTITELGVSIHQGVHFLGSREHAGFLFIRQSFQCLQKIILPPAPFLVGLLVHRWETPWAKVFPLRLMLRLGAEYRYYPCPLVSVRFRDAVYFEIGHTIMKVLADFRNFAYTLPGVRGLTIHMQDRTTDVLFPKNRYDQVIKGLNNSNDHVLAFASNFSSQADSHLVCIQTNTGDESSYQTQAINIHNKPRKVTGASFVVINGALKSSMGLSAKSSIVEDGLMVQIMPEKMEALKAALKNMQDFSIGCGLQGAQEPDETVNIKWVDNDVHFNLGVKSPIDGIPMDGIPSIRVHNGTDYMGTSRFIRWTEVFIIKSDDHPAGVHDPVDINKLSESIARATCAAFVKLLDLLATAGLTKIGVRTTIHPDNVGYEAGSEGNRLPPIYMNSLDNELIQVLHKAAQMSQDTNTVLELIFHVLDD